MHSRTHHIARLSDSPPPHFVQKMWGQLYKSLPQASGSLQWHGMYLSLEDPCYGHMLHYLFLKSDSEHCNSQKTGAIPRPHLLYTPCQDIPQDQMDTSEFRIKGFKRTTPNTDNNGWRIPRFFFEGGDMIISLSDLISSSPSLYRQEDSVKIAISLIKALLFFHNPPWINNLRLDKIRLYQVSDPLFKVIQFKGLHFPFFQNP
jgi:hypothetical protein